jgi:hypothetical protein
MELRFDVSDRLCSFFSSESGGTKEITTTRVMGLQERI